VNWWRALPFQQNGKTNDNMYRSLLDLPELEPVAKPCRTDDSKNRFVSISYRVDSSSPSFSSFRAMPEIAPRQCQCPPRRRPHARSLGQPRRSFQRSDGNQGTLVCDSFVVCEQVFAFDWQ
jgi:hypothetical protein